MCSQAETKIPTVELSSGPTRDPHRAPQRALVIIFLALIAGVPLAQFVIELRRGDRPGVVAIFDRTPTSANLRSYEHSLEDANVLAGHLRPWVQFVQFAWLRDGGEKALVGRGDWLFYKPGFDQTVSRAPTKPTNDPLPAILAFREALAARGVQLLVVPAPNKESVYPDRLVRRAAAMRRGPSPAAEVLLARLRNASIEVVDLFAVFARARQEIAATGGAPLYLAQDSHWSPHGVERAARAVARRLLELGWVGAGPVEFGEKPAPAHRLGDVVRMLRAPIIEERAQLESVPSRQVVRRDDGRAYQDDPNSEILVLGDSFLRVYQHDEPGSAGFVAHLAKVLHQPVTSLVADGGASTLVRQELYRRPALLRNKKAVIWEFVERDIRLGAEGWQIVPLPQNATTKERTSVRADGRFARVLESRPASGGLSSDP